MKNIDRIFSEALQDHATTTPAGLWERVESELPAPSNRQWMRWAAILVPALVAAGLWMNRPEEVTAIAAVNSPAPAIDAPKSPQQEAVAVSAPKKKRTVTSRQAELPVAIASQQPVETVLFPEVVVPDEITIEPVALEPEPVTAEPEPMVLVYTLEPVATPDGAERKESSLNRVVEFARTVKHSDPIGDIRGLKDELFAFDFRKKQTKKN